MNGNAKLLFLVLIVVVAAISTLAAIVLWNQF